MSHTFGCCGYSWDKHFYGLCEFLHHGIIAFLITPAENCIIYLNYSFTVLQYVGRTGGRIQQQAGSALLDVATSGSGAEGCARASADEIDSLLAALQNPSAVVRDAALRVSVKQKSVGL